MKKTKQYISLLLAAFMAAGLSSCIKEDYAGASDETATVNLVFDTRADNDGDGLDDDALPGEGIKTLRVIIVDTDNNRVDVNELRDFSGETPQPVLQKTLTIMGLPVGNKDFYVIANEASVGLIGLDTPRPGYSFDEAEKSALLSTLINDEQRTYFPSTDTEIEENGLPIAGTVSAEITGAEDQTIEIPITRAVAKFVLYITNESGQAFDLTNVNFGRFVTDRTRLFPDQSTVQDISYNEWNASCTTSVSADADGAEAVFTGYIYETGTLEAEDFTLSLTSSTAGFEALETPVLINFSQAGRNYINRNEQVEIHATVNVNREVEVDDLEILVVPWDDNHIIEVPPFE